MKISFISGLMASLLSHLSFALPLLAPPPQTISILEKNPFHEHNIVLSVLDETERYMTLEELTFFLRQTPPILREDVLQKVIYTLTCANHYNILHNHILAVIDYGLPSNEKRLWVYDLKQKKLLYHTYVSHGIGSGELITSRLSNRNNSRASSVGVYKTDAAYYGREGMSLKLNGLEASFNDNASNRAIVMHGGWYVEEDFIKRYGRAGRSWGCPALPEHLSASIIRTIQNHAWLIAYAPNDDWFKKSKYLNCAIPKNPTPTQSVIPSAPALKLEHPTYENVLFAHIKPLRKGDDHAPFLAIDAQVYPSIFKKSPPLRRMLRRQVDEHEYIALSEDELKKLIIRPHDEYKNIKFVQAFIVNRRGYWATQMRFIDFGTIASIALQDENAKTRYIIRFEHKPDIMLVPTHEFVRFIGL